ncbi:MAG: hypothetical protein GSR80_000523 [Desulfurococcales archaeon]|nr:hypothetical protein [Desulfurococcales archaeon]
MLNWLPEWLEFDGRPRIVRLPLQSRNPSRIARRLEPLQVKRPLKALAWLVEKGASLYACLWPPGEYRVETLRRPAYDRLSGLKHTIVAEVRGIIGGAIAWRARWRGDRLVVDGIACKAVVRPGGAVACGDRGCMGPQCLAACLGEP